MEPPTALSRPGHRFVGLDQARALAIIAMIVVHFGPGVFAHVPGLDPLRTSVLWFGRTATPAFVTVFGLTIGFALLPRYRRGEEVDTPRRLRRRAALVFLAAIAVSLPVHARVAVHGESHDWQWLFDSYSVLAFYAPALAVLPLWLRLLRRNTVWRAVIAGLALWAVGSAGYHLWPRGPLSGTEFVRMALLSGGYGYCQMMGTALLAAPVGLWLRDSFDQGAGGRALAAALGAGAGLAAAGGIWGWAAGEYDVARIVSGDLRIPARGWYFLHFGALALAATAGLELLARRAVWVRAAGYPLTLFGQTALLLYTGHAFVLPALEVADQVAPLRGPGRVALAFVPFALFCGVVLYGRHRWLVTQAGLGAAEVAPTPGPEPSDPAGTPRPAGPGRLLIC